MVRPTHTHSICVSLDLRQQRRGVSSQQQAGLDVGPGGLQLEVRVHPEQDPQAAGQAAGLLLQQVGLGLPFEA